VLLILIPIEKESFSAFETYSIDSFNCCLDNDDSNKFEFNRLDSGLFSFFNTWSIVGASVAIMHNGVLKYAKGYGHVNNKADSLVQPTNTFRIASVSKLITAISIMKLVDEGKLKLSDKIFGVNGIINDKAFLSALDYRMYHITVEHLLRHSSGWSLLTYGDPMFKRKYIASELGLEAPPTFDDIIKFVLSNRLPYAPGTRYEYSNFGYCLLGRVIELKTNMNYEDYVKYNILYPNGINSTFIGSSSRSEQGKNEVEYFDFSRNNTRPSFYDTDVNISSTYGSTDLKLLGPAGGWVTSSVDLLKLVSLIDGYQDVPDILTRESLLKMIDTDGYPGRTPIGWRQVKDDWNWVRTGTLAGTNAIVVRQENGFSWTVLINTTNWRTRSFNIYITALMTKEINNISEWPEYDLFNKTSD
jgi:CubicO group peptidase (beta-lactamase class C family)